jgi:type II secretory pathway component GspD/PulD (secretin)
VTQVFRLNYESANNLVPVLRPMIAPNNTITAYPANNTLVITDYADNLRRLARIIAAVDAPASGEVELIPLKNAIASDAAWSCRNCSTRPPPQVAPALATRACARPSWRSRAATR